MTDYPSPDSEPESGVALIAAERQRQIEVEGFTTEHDDAHGDGDLADAAVAYIWGDSSLWPWDDGYNLGDRSHRLVKAGALIAAEIDRLNRAVRV